MVSLWISFGRVAKEVVIPNGFVCREESAVVGGVFAAGKKQIPPLRVRNDNTFAGQICGSIASAWHTWRRRFGGVALAGSLKRLSFRTASFAVRNLLLSAVCSLPAKSRFLRFAFGMTTPLRARFAAASLQRGTPGGVALAGSLWPGPKDVVIP